MLAIPAEIRSKLDAANPLICRQASRNGNLRGDERKLAANCDASRL
jgi:hypothetical protein